MTDGSEATDGGHWPTELRYLGDEKVLQIAFDDGRSYRLPAEYLRVESPSAEVQGHAPSQKTLIHGRRHVGIMAIEPVGHYAVRIKFDDMHDTGLFTWTYLRELGEEQRDRWQRYLAALEAKGLHREPPRQQ